MATDPVTGLNKPVYPNAKFPDEIDPSDRPTIYALTAKGKCLEPVFKDGECIAFSKDAEFQPGDYVGICLVPDAVQLDEPPSRVKRLRSIMPGITFPFQAAPSSELMPLVELEQHNPPRVLRVPADRILSMHKVIGTAKTMGDGTARLVSLEPERLDRLEYVLIDRVQL
ncbi:hypothetical protein [Novosphingobium sp. FKTRR1]|uniref:hypothetical protein n=1 Tax=Novosphingobium sp. FKTRR1 TaxID=2879118 RepID=UPI001CF0411B|nr:hypothetical protein [Novosphingobium sp. FKTRR1]